MRRICLFLVAVGLLVTAWAPGAMGQAPGWVTDVEVKEEHCGEGDRNLAQPYRCAELTVHCPDTENRPVQLRITLPPPGTPVRGTVVFGLGGTGRVFFENAERNGERPSAEMLDRLNLAGFRVIQRVWRDRLNGDPGGWISGSTSLQASACRYTTLMDWIYHQSVLHDPSSQAFCAVGQSGGGSEIGYGLETYGLDQVLDMAVLTGGPPHAQIDGGCDRSSVSWEQTCNAQLETLGICPQQGPDQHACFFSQLSIERDIDAAFDLNVPPDNTPCALVDLPTLVDNDIVSSEPGPDYPNTRVSFVVGEDDCSTAPAMGASYILAVLGSSTGPSDVAVLSDVGHAVPAYEQGAAAIEAVLTAVDGCVLRHP